MKPMHFHNTLKCALLAGLLGGLGALNSHGQYTFNSGSDGSYGPMNITTNTTLNLPPDGKFNCTTITVASGATLKFTTNALNTPVYLLATGDVSISGTIDVSSLLGTSSEGGAGGPGGFAGGAPSLINLPPGDGDGPGAGRAGPNAGPNAVGSASYGSSPSNVQSTTNNGSVYGSPLLVPLAGGSGGGGRYGRGGSGGGGAILIASSTRVDLSGSLISRTPDYNPGGVEDYGYGSGGAIRVVAPVVAGTGTLDVRAGVNTYYTWAGGGGGRIRVDCMDRRALRLSYLPDATFATVGGNMVTIPPNAPHLDITQVGTNDIPVGAGAGVSFTFPQGSSTNQTVKVQASNFGALVPIRVVLIPDNGPSSSYDATIDNAVNPASVTVPVVVPVNVQVHVNAWTR